MFDAGATAGATIVAVNGRPYSNDLLPPGDPGRAGQPRSDPAAGQARRPLSARSRSIIMAGCAIPRWSGSAAGPRAWTPCSRRSEQRGEPWRRSRCLTAALVAGAAAMTATRPAYPPKAATREALQRIEPLNPRLNAVIAVDPTAIDAGARARPAAPRARALVRHADPDQGQYRDGWAAADHGREPRARRQCHPSRRAFGRAAARRGRGDRRQDQSSANGRTSAPTIRSPAGARSAARCAIRMR